MVVGTAAGYLTSGQLVVIVTRASQASHSTLGISFDRRLSWLNAVLALVVALGIQVGTNYVNDYADGVRGHRRAPGRSGAAGGRRPGHGAPGEGGRPGGLRGGRVAGLVLAARVTWWLLPVGLVCALAGWAYTGGPDPTGTSGSASCSCSSSSAWWPRRVRPTCSTPPSRPRGAGSGSRHGFDWGFALWRACRRACWPPPCSRPTTCATSPPTRWPARGRWPCASAAGRAGLLYVGTLAAAGISVAVLAGYRPGRSAGPGCRPARRSSDPPGAGRPEGRALLPHAWRHGTPAAGCRRPADLGFLL